MSKLLHLFIFLTSVVKHICVYEQEQINQFLCDERNVSIICIV